MDIPVKPTVLIADDSRIVRATLIKQIEGLFDFREALDGEQAWEILLVDPSIRVLITDLTMPKLDGYGLLRRIRSSASARLRELPVVVVSGSDEVAERERAKAAGATDLITKGMDTAQLLSRLDILSKLVATQEALQRSLETLVREAHPDVPTASSPDVSASAMDALFASALKNDRNFVLLTVRIGLRHPEDKQIPAAPPASMIEAIGRLLRSTVRQADHVSRSGEAEFTLATSGIGCEAAYCFGQRVCRAIAEAKVEEGGERSLVASCGIASLRSENIDGGQITLDNMRERARRRATLGLHAGNVRAVGRDEEAALQRGQTLSSGAAMTTQAELVGMDNCPDLLTLVRWIRTGKQADVLPYLDKLPADVRALVELALRRTTH